MQVPQQERRDIRKKTCLYIAIWPKHVGKYRHIGNLSAKNPLLCIAHLKTTTPILKSMSILWTWMAALLIYTLQSTAVCCVGNHILLLGTWGCLHMRFLLKNIITYLRTWFVLTTTSCAFLLKCKQISNSWLLPYYFSRLTVGITGYTNSMQARQL